MNVKAKTSVFTIEAITVINHHIGIIIDHDPTLLNAYKTTLNYHGVDWYHSSSDPLGVTVGQVVIVGTGWASFRVLADIDTKKNDVTVISPRNHLLFTPMLLG